MKWVFDTSAIDYRYLIVNIEGKFTVEEQKQMLDEIENVEGWQPDVPILFDNRRLDTSEVNLDLIRHSVTVLIDFTKNLPKTKIAGLVTSDLNFGFGRQFETIYEMEEGASFRVFRNESVAIEWLTEK